MFTRMKIGIKRVYTIESQGCDLSNRAFGLPRLWMILLVLALPFFSLCADYLEALERTGTLGAIIADAVLPASTIAYAALVVVLKKRKI